MTQDQDIVERLRLHSGTRNFLVTEATALDAAEAIERLTQELAGMVESANSYAHQAARLAIELAEERSRWAPAALYFERYCQDEADDVENCVCGLPQHEDAKAFAAVARGEG